VAGCWTVGRAAEDHTVVLARGILAAPLTAQAQQAGKRNYLSELVGETGIEPVTSAL